MTVTSERPFAVVQTWVDELTVSDAVCAGG
jgi:hypothetical protein